MFGGRAPLIDHAVRYLAILRLLRNEVSAQHSILEVGSGPYGVGEYCPRSFVGCDFSFSESPRLPMLPVRASGLQLPFRDSSFDAVVASDVLEHVPPEGRPTVLREALRVACKVVLIGFPCGSRAYALDQRLWSDFRNSNRPVPPWLTEHMAFPFPDETLFEGVGSGWLVRSLGNDNLWFHNWLIRRLSSPYWCNFFATVERKIPHVLEQALRLVDCPPCYRRIFVLTRSEMVSGYAPGRSKRNY